MLGNLVSFIDLYILFIYYMLIIYFFGPVAIVFCFLVLQAARTPVVSPM